METKTYFIGWKHLYDIDEDLAKQIEKLKLVGMIDKAVGTQHVFLPDIVNIYIELLWQRKAEKGKYIFYNGSIWIPATFDKWINGQSMIYHKVLLSDVWSVRKGGAVSLDMKWSWEFVPVWEVVDRINKLNRLVVIKNIISQSNIWKRDDAVLRLTNYLKNRILTNSHNIEIREWAYELYHIATIITKLPKEDKKEALRIFMTEWFTSFNNKYGK